MTKIHVVIDDESVVRAAFTDLDVAWQFQESMPNLELRSLVLDAVVEEVKAGLKPYVLYPDDNGELAHVELACGQVDGWGERNRKIVRGHQGRLLGIRLWAKDPQDALRKAHEALEQESHMAS